MKRGLLALQTLKHTETIQENELFRANRCRLRSQLLLNRFLGNMPFTASAPRLVFKLNWLKAQPREEKGLRNDDGRVQHHEASG